jgi:hypothetical protein
MVLHRDHRIAPADAAIGHGRASADECDRWTQCQGAAEELACVSLDALAGGCGMQQATRVAEKIFRVFVSHFISLS